MRGQGRGDGMPAAPAETAESTSFSFLPPVRLPPIPGSGDGHPGERMNCVGPSQGSPQNANLGWTASPGGQSSGRTARQQTGGGHWQRGGAGAPEGPGPPGRGSVRSSTCFSFSARGSPLLCPWLRRELPFLTAKAQSCRRISPRFRSSGFDLYHRTARLTGCDEAADEAFVSTSRRVCRGEALSSHD
ncbi:glycine-rich protein GRP33-like [Mustela lutreola]|uniref:glycine-rich protein GRP33-like n=1 Tax=Mustela lutreola TaxID=9666 RepID=UPI002796F641|nr:glycine-rich protein GRP33-like [Mustela lutreola]